MTDNTTIKLLALPLLCAVAIPAQAAHWGAWGQGSKLRPAQFHQMIQNQIPQPAAVAVTASVNQASHAATASLADRKAPTQDIRLGDATRLVSATSALSYSPTTGALIGPLSGGSGSGTGGTGGGGGGGGGGSAANLSPGLAVHDPYEPFVTTFLGGSPFITELDGVSPATGTPTSLVSNYGMTLDVAGSGSVTRAGADSGTGIQWGALEGGYTQSGSMGSSKYTSAVHNAAALFAYGPAASAVPTSGTINYTVLGSVIRDNISGVANGTLNSASLAVNFTNATANFAVSATAGGATFTGTASNLEIGTFNSTSATISPPVRSTAWSAYGTTMITAACTSGCTAGTSMKDISTLLVGQMTGAGATGAITAFNLNAVNASGVVTQGVSGVVAFKK